MVITADSRKPIISHRGAADIKIVHDFYPKRVITRIWTWIGNHQSLGSFSVIVHYLFWFGDPRQWPGDGPAWTLWPAWHQSSSVLCFVWNGPTLRIYVKQWKHYLNLGPRPVYSAVTGRGCWHLSQMPLWEKTENCLAWISVTNGFVTSQNYRSFTYTIKH